MVNKAKEAALDKHWQEAMVRILAVAAIVAKRGISRPAFVAQVVRHIMSEGQPDMESCHKELEKHMEESDDVLAGKLHNEVREELDYFLNQEERDLCVWFEDLEADIMATIGASLAEKAAYLTSGENADEH